ncbi:MAG: RNA polymerase sigma factor [Terriglobia bacterium]|jgi:RNA polymerase sigma-70 factor (ECF subfamily)
MATRHLDSIAAERLGDDEQERTLVLAAQRGDAGALRELYHAYRDRVWSLVMYSVGDFHLAQDVLQTVFLKVFRGLKDFRFQSSLATWIYRIAHNECQEHHRRHRTPHVPLETILGSSSEIDTRPILDDQHAHRERQLIIQRALMQLSLKLRTVIVLKYVEGLTYQEMSRVLGCAPGTVASRLNRALAELEERLRPFRGIM